MKHNNAQVDGRNLWDWEIELLTKLEMPLHDARNDIISLWMGMGDLRPLGAAITERLRQQADVEAPRSPNP
jgi:hypothetical protein